MRRFQYVSVDEPLAFNKVTVIGRRCSAPGSFALRVLGFVRKRRSQWETPAGYSGVLSHAGRHTARPSARIEDTLRVSNVMTWLRAGDNCSSG